MNDRVPSLVTARAVDARLRFARLRWGLPLLPRVVVAGCTHPDEFMTTNDLIAFARSKIQRGNDHGE